MSLDFSSTALIADVKRRAMAPTSQSLFQNTDFCAILTSEMKSKLIPLIKKVKEDFFLSSKDFSIDGTTRSFAIPDRAIGMAIRNVEYADPNNNDEQRAPRTTQGNRGTSPYWADIGGYYLQDNDIVFDEAPTDTSMVIRVYYYRRPSKLVRTSDAGKITAINTLTKTVTLDNVPTAWTTSYLFDFTKGKGGFQSLGDDKVITAINGFDVTFSATLPTSLAVGDWVAEAGESPIAQIPYDGHDLLAQLAAIKVLEGQGDPNLIKFAQDKAMIMEADFLAVISKRVETQPKKIVSRRGLMDYQRSNNNRY
jgi:hypothetical protein